MNYKIMYCKYQSAYTVQTQLIPEDISCRYYSSEVGREIVDPLISTQKQLSFIHEKIKKVCIVTVYILLNNIIIRHSYQYITDVFGSIPGASYTCWTTAGSESLLF